MRESATTSIVRLAAAKLGIDLWRNNSGVLPDENGRPVRFGLGSFTKKDEKASSDFIGITPVNAYVEGIGWTVLGVFTAVEMKPSDWKFYQSDKRACYQKNFHDIVRKNGGFAGFATNEADFLRIIRRG